MAETKQMEPASQVEPPKAEKPSGPVAAAFWAAGIGALVLGILTTLAEANETVHDKLELSKAVGTLSGKTVFALVAWVVSWVVLHVILRNRDVRVRTLFTVTAVLVASAVVLTFPTFFLLFAPEE